MAVFTDLEKYTWNIECASYIMDLLQIHLRELLDTITDLHAKQEQLNQACLVQKPQQLPSQQTSAGAEQPTSQQQPSALVTSGDSSSDLNLASANGTATNTAVQSIVTTTQNNQQNLNLIIKLQEILNTLVQVIKYFDLVFVCFSFVFKVKIILHVIYKKNDT